MERVKFGTYPATLGAADWENILVALGAACDVYKQLGLPNTADSFQVTLDRLRPQVLEDRP